MDYQGDFYQVFEVIDALVEKMSQEEHHSFMKQLLEEIEIRIDGIEEEMDE